MTLKPYNTPRDWPKTRGGNDGGLFFETVERGFCDHVAVTLMRKITELDADRGKEIGALKRDKERLIEALALLTLEIEIHQAHPESPPGPLQGIIDHARKVLAQVAAL